MLQTAATDGACAGLSELHDGNFVATGGRALSVLMR